MNVGSPEDHLKSHVVYGMLYIHIYIYIEHVEYM